MSTYIDTTSDQIDLLRSELVKSVKFLFEKATDSTIEEIAAFSDENAGSFQNSLRNILFRFASARNKANSELRDFMNELADLTSKLSGKEELKYSSLRNDDFTFGELAEMEENLVGALQTTGGFNMTQNLRARGAKIEVPQKETSE